MSRTSLQDVRGLPDIFQTWNFDLFLPSIPGGGDTRSITLKTQTTSVPVSTIDPVDVPLHGVNLQFAGRQTFTHTLQMTVLETRDMTTRDAFRLWQEYARSQQSNSGNYKSAYAITAELVLYDDVPSPVKSIFLQGCWCTAVGDLALDGSSSTPGSYEITLQFDSISETGVNS